MSKGQKIAAVMVVSLMCLCGPFMQLLQVIALIIASVWLWWFAWTIWAFIGSKQIQRQNALHPVWKKYPVSCQAVFGKVNKAIVEARYGYGSKWTDVRANTQTNKISADLRLTEGATGAGGHQKRWIHIEAQIEDVDGGKAAVLKLAFNEQSQGITETSYEIIRDLVNTIDNSLEGGVAITEPVNVSISGPPDILLELSIVTVIAFYLPFAYVLMQEFAHRFGIPTSIGTATTQKSPPTQTATQNDNTEKQYAYITATEGGRQTTYEITILPGQSKEEAINNFWKQHKENEENMRRRLKEELGLNKNNSEDNNSGVIVNDGDTSSVTTPMPVANTPRVPNMSGQEGVERTGGVI